MKDIYNNSKIRSRYRSNLYPIVFNSKIPEDLQKRRIEINKSINKKDIFVSKRIITKNIRVRQFVLLHLIRYLF